MTHRDARWLWLGAALLWGSTAVADDTEVEFGRFEAPIRASALPPRSAARANAASAPAVVPAAPIPAVPAPAAPASPAAAPAAPAAPAARSAAPAARATAPAPPAVPAAPPVARSTAPVASAAAPAAAPAKPAAPAAAAATTAPPPPAVGPGGVHRASAVAPACSTGAAAQCTACGCAANGGAADGCNAGGELSVNGGAANVCSSCGNACGAGCSSGVCCNSGPCGNTGACGSCGESCCDPCGGNFCMDACDCGPTIGGEVNWLFLRREHPRGAPILQNGGVATLSARDFDIGSHPGVEASLWMSLDAETRIAGRYFWLDQRVDTLQVPVRAGGGLATNPPEARPPSNDELTYASQLQSAELGTQKSLTEYLQLGAGFRYLEFKERLRDRAVDAGGAGFVGYDQFSTLNNLYGAQVSANVALYEIETLRFSAFGNAGLYANNASSAAIANITVAPIGRASDSRTSAAFVGELGLTCSAQLTPSLSMLYGYRFLWLEGVALAGEQVSQTRFAPPARTNIDTNGGAFLHGLQLGVLFAF